MVQGCTIGSAGGTVPLVEFAPLHLQSVQTTISGSQIIAEAR